MRAAAIFLTIVSLTATILSGCVQDETEGDEPVPPMPATVRFVDSVGAPVPFAQLTIFQDDGILLLSADAEAALDDVPAGRRYIAGAQGFGAVNLTVLSEQVMLPPNPIGEVAELSRFRVPVDLTCPAVDPPPYSCGRFGEPVVEVAGDGTIWASATCCVGRSPPIWTSRDGGLTFQLLPGQSTGLVRDAYGIEGDFAIDDAGNVYFFDIAGTASYITSFEADGTHRWTVPFPFPPLVDRPWIRAGKADQVFIHYNTGQTTRFYESVDGGKTWDVPGGDEFDCPLGTIGQGPNRNDLFVVACADEAKIWTSRDGGKTWSAPESVPFPDGKFGDERMADFRMPPVADAAGNVYVPFQHRVDPSVDDVGMWLARRSADGAWAGPWLMSPEKGLNYLPWPAAGDAGRFAVAWYHADDSEEDDSTKWRLMTASSFDADSAEPHFQLAYPDPEVLHTGLFGRALGDFLESDITPDGRFVVVYAKQVGGGGVAADADDVLNRFISTDGGLDFGRGVPYNGPLA